MSLSLFNPLQKGKILDWFKMKALADDKVNIAEIIISLSNRVENIVRKGENAGFQHFSHFPTMFSKALFFRIVKSRDCVVKS